MCIVLDLNVVVKLNKKKFYAKKEAICNMRILAVSTSYKGWFDNEENEIYINS